MSVQFDDPFAGSDVEYQKTPALKFPTEGTTYSGTVTALPKLVQQKEYKPTGDGPPAYWDKERTQPKMAVVVELEVDGEKVSLWAPKPSNLFRNIGDAQKQAGQQIQLGGTLAVKYTHDAPTPNGFVAKQYAVKYTPGTPKADDPFANHTAADAQPPF